MARPCTCSECMTRRLIADAQTTGVATVFGSGNYCPGSCNRLTGGKWCGPGYCEVDDLKRAAASTQTAAAHQTSRPCGVCGKQPPCSCFHNVPLSQAAGPVRANVEAQERVEGVKHDLEKDPWHLLPTRAVRAVVRVLGYGARKYTPNNWRKVEGARERYYAAALRHLTAWFEGESTDPESGMHHLAHAVCCVLFLLEGGQ